MGYALNWDLDVFFKGGSSSGEFLLLLDEIKQDVTILDRLVHELDPKGNETALIEALDLYKVAQMKVAQAGSFIGCLVAQDVQDKKASQLRMNVMKVEASLQTVFQ